MFMTRKILVCLSVFMLLFIGAFTLNRELSRDFYDPAAEGADGMVQIQQLNDGTTFEAIKHQIFAPREYVRIIQSDE